MGRIVLLVSLKENLMLFQVLNAIDAKATCIAVRVDLNLFKIQVIDNGVGISQEDLGRVGTRYSILSLSFDLKD